MEFLYNRTLSDGNGAAAGSNVLVLSKTSKLMPYRPPHKVGPTPAVLRRRCPRPYRLDSLLTQKPGDMLQGGLDGQENNHSDADVSFKAAPKSPLLRRKLLRTSSNEDRSGSCIFVTRRQFDHCSICFSCSA